MSQRTLRTGLAPGSAEPQELLVDGRPVAAAHVATSTRARARGLLGRDGFDGALLIWPATSIHTFGMRFPLDLACCRNDGVVVAVLCLPARRVTRPRPRARFVVEAEAGAFARWGVRVGSTLSVARVRSVRPPA